MSKNTITLAALLFTTVAMAQQGSKEVKRTTAVAAKPTAQTTTTKVETKQVVRSAEYNKRAEERANRGRKESWGNQKAPFKK